MKMLPTLNHRPLYFNAAQQRVILCQAKVNVHIWGRGTGKSDIDATEMVNDVHEMPGSCGVIVGSTYQSILTRTLPPIISSLERMGYKNGVHYFIGTKPPKIWKDKGLFPDPYVAPLSHEYFMHWYTGAGYHLVSQDRPGTSNGLSVDSIRGMEAKFLNFQKLSEETFPTLRGNKQYFGHLARHQSITFTTDMPATSTGDWLFQYKDICDMQLVELIINMQLETDKLKLELTTCLNDHKSKLLQHEIKKQNKMLNELRKECVYYSEASSLENIEVLGENYIKQQKRDLPSFVFQTAILNIRPRKIEGSFYPDFDINKHGYDAFNYSFLDSIGNSFNNIKELDHRQDTDCDIHAPLEIAIDYGGHINVMVVAQDKYVSYNFINALYAKHPKNLKDLLNNFHNYYKGHKRKEVYFYYDHTAIGKDAVREFTLAETVLNTLTGYGWIVKPCYFGQAPEHDIKYELNSKLLRQRNEEGKTYIQINKTHCEHLIESIELAPIREDRGKLKKDKTSEDISKGIPQEKATHFSDAFDMLLFGKFSGRLTLTTFHSNMFV